MAWHLIVEYILRPFKTMGFGAKPMTKKSVNDKFIELLQIEWYTENATIRLR